MEFITTDILLYTALGLIIILAIWLAVLDRRLSRILVGKNAKTLEDSILFLADKTKELSRGQKTHVEQIELILEKLETTVRGVHTVRFNPFHGTGSGGNQSFATAFVNNHGEGVVISSIYSRDRVSVYAKPLSNFTSEYELTGEEQKAIAGAKEKNHA